MIAWFVALFTGRLPEGLHGFIARYLRALTHLSSYLLLLANPVAAVRRRARAAIPSTCASTRPRRRAG